MDTLTTSLLLAVLAGITIPLGAHLASIEHIRPRWLENEFRHGVIAFGGGVLLAAVSLVLVPEGIKHLPLTAIIVSFTMGGLGFALIDRWVAQSGLKAAQFIAMLIDFIPEALALGAALATGQSIGFLLALLIALQNFPEGFNAFREMTAGGAHRSGRVLRNFWLIILVGPLSAFLGHEFLSGSPQILGVIMLFAASGIIYLTFEDIAPQTVLKRHWGPPLGAVAGFLVGLIGHIAIG